MRKIVYVDMDDVLCDFTGASKKALEVTPGIQYPQSQLDFFRNLTPLPGAIESFKKLFSRFDVYILTAPSVINPLSYMEKRIWVEEHLGLDVAKRLIISPNKGLLKGDYLIDDRAEGKGQESFEGTQILFGGSFFRDWDSVMTFFNGVEL
jgi:5'-nucleotidase